VSNRCYRCQQPVWRWCVGTGYDVTVCDGCYEITLPTGALRFDSGREYQRKAEELVAALKAARQLGSNDQPVLV
jgi:hypothetical protein